MTNKSICPFSYRDADCTRFTDFLHPLVEPSIEDFSGLEHAERIMLYQSLETSPLASNAKKAVFRVFYPVSTVCWLKTSGPQHIRIIRATDGTSNGYHEITL